MARTYRETPEVAAGVLRIVRALGQRISTGDPDELQLLNELAGEVVVAFQVAVDGIREAGFSDGDIGNALGITKQAVQKRWPRLGG